MKNAYRKWRKDTAKKKEYIRRRELSESYAKRRKREEKLEEKINIKTEAQVWKLINKGKERKAVDAEIKIEEWKNYFSHLLKGSKKEEREPNESRNLSIERRKN